MGWAEQGVQWAGVSCAVLGFAELHWAENASDEWTFAPPCYEHVFDVIKGNGELAHLSALDFLPKNK